GRARRGELRLGGLRRRRQRFPQPRAPQVGPRVGGYDPPREFRRPGGTGRRVGLPTLPGRGRNKPAATVLGRDAVARLLLRAAFLLLSAWRAGEYWSRARL